MQGFNFWGVFFLTACVVVPVVALLKLIKMDMQEISKRNISKEEFNRKYNHIIKERKAS